MNKKSMQKVLLSSLFILLGISITQSSYADGYETYQRRVKEICSQKEYEPRFNFLKTQIYPKVEKGNGIEDAKTIYRDNMNSIYKCALIRPQIQGLEKVEKLIDKTPSLQKKLSKKVQDRMKKLQESKKKFNCSEKEISKADVLKTVSKEICTYHSYLEYLREHNSDISKLLETDSQEKLSKSYNLGTVANLEQEKKAEIDREIERSYQIFPIAFDAYNQYETNLGIHILLELIKEDYIALRKKLHQSLNPINQVVYKIINAMKK